MADDIEQPDEPQDEDLLAEVQEDAQQASEGLAAAPEPVVQDAPGEVLKDMAETTAFAAEEAQVDADASGDVDLLPDGDLPIEAPAISASDSAEPPADFASDIPSALEILAGSEPTAAKLHGIPNASTQTEQVQATELDREQNLYEMDAGPFEGMSAGMEMVGAMTAAGESDIAWKRLATQMLLDHHRELEQLRAALERER